MYMSNICQIAIKTIRPTIYDQFDPTLSQLLKEKFENNIR